MRFARFTALALCLAFTARASDIPEDHPVMVELPKGTFVPEDASANGPVFLPPGYFSNLKGYQKLSEELTKLDVQVADLGKQNEVLKQKTDEAGSALKLTPLSVALLLGGGLALGFSVGAILHK